MTYREAFPLLKDGDDVLYDARKLFMDRPKWVSATFVKWMGTYPAPGVYCNGCLNDATLLVEGREVLTDSGYMRPAS